MKRIMAVLTDEQESFVGAIGITGMTTDRTRLACVVRVYIDSHRRVQERLVGNHTLQLRKGPLGIGRISPSLLEASFLALLTPGSLTNVCQIFQADKAVGVSKSDAFGDHM